MKRKDIIELKIEKMHYGGKSEGKIEEKRIILKGGIKGQTVKAVVKKSRDNQVQASIIEVVEKSPDETKNTCKEFGVCGGCAYLSVDYETQIEYKTEMLKELFVKSGHNEFGNLVVEKSPEVYEYKNKMEFTFGNEIKDGELNIGLHKKNSAMSIIDVSDCMLVTEDYRKILTAVRDFFRERKVSHYHIMKHEGVLRHLVLRRGRNTNTILINLVTTSEIYNVDVDLKEFVKVLSSLELKDEITGIIHTINDSLSDTVKSDYMNVLYGKEIFIDKVLRKEYLISPFSFFQTNTKGAEVLYTIAVEMIRDLSGQNVIFDLYSGTGTIGIALSGEAKRIYSIEIVQEAVEMAEQNAIRNNISNIEFICGDVGEKVSMLSQRGIKPDIIVIDPPRGGITPKALRDIIDFDAENILYISCNAKCLVSDLTVLKQSGYLVRKVKAVDIFPNTNHVECIALIQRVKS